MQRIGIQRLWKVSHRVTCRCEIDLRRSNAGKSIFKIYSRRYHKITIEDNFVQYFGLKHIKFSGFRKGVRGRTLFPPEKGFPRVPAGVKLISAEATDGCL